jgi:WD40 repeat protein/tRNA A-37 threonylcarbamoyl transferase component Bud32
MTPEQARAREIFEEVIDLPSAEWAGMVDLHCAADDALRREVTRLLAGHRADDSFLDRPLVERTPVPDGRTSYQGARIGPYRLTAVLGRGGMATVYRASRDDGSYRGEVAVKVLERERLGPGGARRVRQEREALASLEHPHVARLLDAGETADGDPYLVMTLVDGVPITEYCTRHAPPIPERIRLFLQVCDAVDAAHRRAILHRDLKPTNILVTPEGQATLLDFGLSRSLDRSSVTTLGAHWLTPAYASPEQIRGESLTTSADVYALGVVLFEMVTGELPYAVSRDDPFAIAYAVVSGTVRSARAIAPTVPADLDAVLLKAKAPEVNGRYGSVSELREELQRVLDGRPVMAQPPTLAYRARRFVRRHTAAVVASVLAGAVVMGAVGAALWQGRVAARQAAENRRLLYAAELKLAVQALEGGSPDLMQQLLQGHVPVSGQPDLRGVEWYLLDRLRPEPDLVVPVTSVANAIAWSRDDRWLATAGSDGAITLWNTAGTGPGRIIGRHTGKTWGVSFSPDGHLLASVGSDRRLRVWRVSDGTLALDVRAHDEAVRAVSFLAGGSALISGAEDGTVRVHALVGGRRLLEFRTETPHIRGLDVAPDGSAVVVASDLGLVTHRTLGTRPLTRSKHVGANALSAARFTPDGRTVVAASLAGTVTAWDLSADVLSRGDHVREGMMEAVEVARDGLHVFGAHGPWVTSWHLDDWQVRVRKAAHAGRTMAVALSSNGDRLATAGSDQTVRIWPAQSEPDLPTLPGHAQDVWAVAFSADSARLASAGNDGKVRFWDASTGALTRTIETGSITVKAVAFDADGGRLFAGLREGDIVALNSATAQVADTLSKHASQLHRLALSPDGRRLGAVSEDLTATIWDLMSGTLLHVLPHGSVVRGISFSPDGRRVATASDDAMVHVWEVSTGVEVGVLRGHTATVNDVEYSPDGRLLLSSSADQTLRLWNAAALTPQRVLRGHLDRIWDVAFSPDGTRIASASSDATVRIWDVASGRELISLASPMAWRSVAFSPDGEKLAAGNASGSISLWLAPRTRPRE